MFQLEIEGFSGPLDLLCHMIDQGQIEAARVSVAEVISIYGAYLARSGGLPIASIAEFIAQAAHLVRQKASSLLPRYEPCEDDGEIAVLDDDEDVESLLERYRPYREAVSRLVGLKEKADRRRFRKGEALDPFFDLGDLYSLSLQWLELLNRRRSASLELLDEDDWDDGGVPAQIPDEVQVENRMERVLERLTAFSEGLSLRSLLKEEPGRGALVVTLLALLELSRRNFVTLVQKELFGDVFITARRA
ncbi:segregation/condensation protein A [Pyramidobacter sp. SM-530-WT-4B]|uniref:Segregation and condensation protein A n=1 Tax=Pyramidobacter porci TaxID=2605789 RepID=A0A6L5Y8M0_9BACT|nr:segregation/condensation protein A [Pyramidobacter porci]MCI6260709.1 segregation/condensation protein A [Pyramidobacter sp.]MDY2647553.1 segregation/condensation protein A [Pyramidobacter porci]MST54533.1 segregation/condensation protein A [Pyramidobacter porci]